MILRFSTILVLLMLPLSAFSELTKNDIEAIRSIVKEEATASETRIKEYVDLKVENITLKIEEMDKRLSNRIDSLNTRFDDLRGTTYAVLGVLTVWLMGILGYVIHTRITVGRLIESLTGIENSANELVKKNEEIQNRVTQLVSSLEESIPQFQTESN